MSQTNKGPGNPQPEPPGELGTDLVGSGSSPDKFAYHVDCSLTAVFRNQPGPYYSCLPLSLSPCLSCHISLQAVR